MPNGLRAAEAKRNRLSFARKERTKAVEKLPKFKIAPAQDLDTPYTAFALALQHHEFREELAMRGPEFVEAELRSAASIGQHRIFAAWSDLDVVERKRRGIKVDLSGLQNEILRNEHPDAFELVDVINELIMHIESNLRAVLSHEPPSTVPDDPRWGDQPEIRL